MLRKMILIVSLAIPFFLSAQPIDSTLHSSSLHVTWLPQKSGVNASLRGLSAVDDEVAWASGTNGIFVRTIDGGKTWKADTVAGASSLDFRDVEAFSASSAILMSAGSGELSRIYKTTDGGKNWKLCFKNTIVEGFFDGMAFGDDMNGILVGDPVEGGLFIMTTADGGFTWNRVPPENIPPVFPKEYAFAASGTGIFIHGTDHLWIGTGGGVARVFRSTDRGKTWTVATTPIISGNESSGIFSLVFRDSFNGMAVGGNYKNPNDETANVATTEDGGQIWALMQDSKPQGYRSSIAYVANSVLPMFVAVGPSGSDFTLDFPSLNGERVWFNFGSEGYHAVSAAKFTNAVWASGADGRIAKLNNDFEGNFSRLKSNK